MKHYLLFIILLFIYGCSVQRHSSSTLASDRTVHSDQITSMQLLWQQDSSSRYWIYRTDTAFFFHPDSGLFGRGGRLELFEARRDEKFGYQIYDSARRQVYEYQQVEQRTFSERIPKVRYGWITVVAVLIAIVWWRMR